MSAFLIQFAVSNLVLSAVLAAVAYAVHRQGRYPVMAHLLWVLVLVKLVTPPLFALPLPSIPGSDGLIIQPVVAARVMSVAPSGLDLTAAWLVAHGVTVLLLAWALGSLVVLAASVLRIRRFDRLLLRTTSVAPAEIQWLAHDAARQLEIHSVPPIHTTTARLSPMTWWVGGPVRIVIPEALQGQVGVEQLRWVLAHELAHVKRRDHLVRWLEWLACVSFWWNPVAWWARRNLRFDEEASCDALVLNRLGPQPRSYAASLLAVVELLSRPMLHPPAVATGIDGGGSLEQRLRMIISGQPARRAPKWLVAGVVAASLAVMPLGLGAATDHDADDAPEAVAGPSLEGPQVVDLSEAELAFLRLDAHSGTMSTVGAVADGGTTALLSASMAKPSTKLATKQVTKAGQAKNAKNAKSAKSAKSAKKRAARKAARQADAAAASAAASPAGKVPGIAARPLGRVLRS